jgi:hypothetical protein
MHLKWRGTSLDLNILEVEYLCSESRSDTFYTSYLDVNCKKVQVIQDIFSNLVENVKAFCSGL